MTRRKPCVGSGHIVLGPDEPDGTVYCGRCGRIDLPMETTLTETGATGRCIPEHYGPVAAPKLGARPKGVHSSTGELSRRNRRDRPRR